MHQNFKFSNADMLLIAEALAALPYHRVAPLIDNIQQQINGFVQASAPVPEATNINPQEPNA